MQAASLDLGGDEFPSDQFLFRQSDAAKFLGISRHLVKNVGSSKAT